MRSLFSLLLVLLITAGYSFAQEGQFPFSKAPEWKPILDKGPFEISPHQKITLRFRPSVVPLRYNYRQRDKVCKRDWDMKKHEFFYDHIKQYEVAVRSIRPTAAATEDPDILELTTKQTYGAHNYNGRQVQRLLKEKTQKEYSTVLGQYTDGEGKLLPPTFVGRPILPQRDVAIGDTWQEVRLAREEFPMEVLTVYKFIGYRRRRGRRCAFIEMNSYAQGHHPDENSSVDLRMKGQFYFAINEGFVLLYNRNSRITIKTIKDKKKGAPYCESRVIDTFYRFKG